jgi:hypothetical protein
MNRVSIFSKTTVLIFFLLNLFLILAGNSGSAQAAGYSLKFDGVDDYVAIPDTNGDFDFDTAFTVESWVKPLTFSGSGQYKAIVRGAHVEPPAPPSGGWVMFQSYLDYSSWGLSVCVPGCEAAVSGPGNLVLNEWQHLAGVYNGTFITIYRNGTLVSTYSYSGNVSDLDYGVIIGLWVESFNGLIDEVRIWNISRTQAEIQADMNHILSGNETGLVGYWRFDEGIGQTVSDSTSHNNNGRLGSTSSVDINDPAWDTEGAPITRPLGALPVSQCISLFESETEKISASVRNDFNGCIMEDSVKFYRSSDCTGEVIEHSFLPPDSGFVYKSGTMGGCPEAVEVTKSSPVCVEITLKSGRKTTVCY